SNMISLSEWVEYEKKIQAKKVLLKKKIDKENKTTFICKNPRGSYKDCYWKKVSNQCIRYTCNLSGKWAQKTIFENNPDCPVKPKIKACEWMN
ncbi:MAG: hypothetical protein KDD45_17595, partial [Bdellovibrionales bacterium]|nr:hypothetical protein [Bdellovibrionales bacterium]